MIQCKDCEFFSRDKETGRITLRCNPFSTIKEPACLEKLQLMRLDGLLQMYSAMLRWNQKLAPMQKKLFDFMEKEIRDVDESDGWKYGNTEGDQDEEDDSNMPDEDGDNFKI